MSEPVGMCLIDRNAMENDIAVCCHEHSGLYGGACCGVCGLIEKAPAVDAVPVAVVAQMFHDFTGDWCACNYNGNDEWLPLVCENTNWCPDHEDELYCWKQFVKHYGERRTDEKA